MSDQVKAYSVEFLRKMAENMVIAALVKRGESVSEATAKVVALRVAAWPEYNGRSPDVVRRYAERVAENLASESHVNRSWKNPGLVAQQVAELRAAYEALFGAK